MTDFPIDPSTRRSGPYTATAAQTVFDYGFPVLDADDLGVYRLPNGGTTETRLARGTNYTVTGVGLQAGGTIVLTAPAAAGDRITIVGERTPRRLTDFGESGALTAAALNLEFDALAIQSQEQATETGRTLRLPDGDPDADMRLPLRAARASKVLGFDATGQPVASALTIAQIEAGATTATAQAAIATTQAGIATGAAGTATTQAGIATAQAAAAAASAASIALPLPIASGGTGATNAAAARAALGVSDGVARSGVNGLSGANNSGTPNTQYDFAANEVLLTNGASGFVLRTATGTLTNNVLTAGSTANGRDQAGAFTAGSWIHFWFIWNGTTLATLSSASATAPTLPSGYTHRAYIGAVYFNGSSQLVATRMRGSKVFYAAAQNALTGGTATAETSVSLTALVPPNALRTQLRLFFQVSAGASSGNSFGTLRIVAGSNFHRMEGFQQAGLATSYESASIEVPNLSQAVLYITGDVSADGAQSLTIDVQGYAIPNGDA